MTLTQQTPAQEIAARCVNIFGRNDDARLTATCDQLSSVAGHVSREYGECSDGSTFYLAADRYGNVARIEEREET